MDFKKVILLLIVGFNCAFSQQNIVVKVQGIKELKGSLAVQVKDKNSKVVFQKMFPVSKETESLTIDNLNSKLITVECFHDTNSNKELDTNFVGIPTEPWGVSKNVRPSFRGPTHDEMLIDISKLTEISIVIK